MFWAVEVGNRPYLRAELPWRTLSVLRVDEDVAILIYSEKGQGFTINSWIRCHSCGAMYSRGNRCRWLSMNKQEALQLDQNEFLKKLQASSTGLSQKEAARR